MKIYFILVIFVSISFGTGFPPSYYEIKDTKVQKREFIRILKPLVEKANEVIEYERNFITSFFDRALIEGFREFKEEELASLIAIAKKYRIKKLFNRDEYVKRVDVVPLSLALSQGAIESGWGKSRFVKEANNIFGHWTWGEYGLIPESRDEDKTHKIRIFQSLQASVNAYVLNLNRNYAYKSFRELRYSLKSQGKYFTGIEAASTMKNYSELRGTYIKMLQRMMKNNKLLKYDR
jgi:Bax protein